MGRRGEIYHGRKNNQKVVADFRCAYTGCIYNRIFVAVYLGDLLPTEQLIYRYDGSLTTPPCTPNILWSVMQTPIEMSAEQIAEFTRIMEGNNRPLQALNNRVLQLDETP